MPQRRISRWHSFHFQFVEQRAKINDFYIVPDAAPEGHWVLPEIRAVTSKSPRRRSGCSDRIEPECTPSTNTQLHLQRSMQGVSGRLHDRTSRIDSIQKSAQRHWILGELSHPISPRKVMPIDPRCSRMSTRHLTANGTLRRIWRLGIQESDFAESETRSNPMSLNTALLRSSRCSGRTLISNESFPIYQGEKASQVTVAEAIDSKGASTDGILVCLRCRITGRDRDEPR